MNLQRYSRLLPTALAVSLVLTLVLGGNAAAYWLESHPIFSQSRRAHTITDDRAAPTIISQRDDQDQRSDDTSSDNRSDDHGRSNDTLLCCNNRIHRDAGTDGCCRPILC